MTAGRRSKTNYLRDNKESGSPSILAGSSATECKPCAVRRRYRLQQRTSPYFEASKGIKLGGVTSAHCTAKRRRKSALVPPPAKLERDAETEPRTESVRVHGLARQVNFYSLIQEIVTPNVFRLLVATCLLNHAVTTTPTMSMDASKEPEPGWKSVMPLDKELRADLIWRWAKEGQMWA
ncbi:hypothetical protein NDA13_006463 [Ustilago tritici]|nr:hypothetical protein NDA13_006463 [Ustilago tritici]